MLQWMKKKFFLINFSYKKRIVSRSLLLEEKANSFPVIKIVDKSRKHPCKVFSILP